MSEVAEAVLEERIEIDATPFVLLKGGEGTPLLILHDELGFPGWMEWNDALAGARAQIIPLQPGFGRSAPLPWVKDYRDLAAYYARLVRQLGAPVDVIGFSAGAYLGAEMAVLDPGLFRKLILVGPLGVKPTEGEIFDFLAVTARTHVAATVSKRDAPEFAKIYGGEMGPEQFKLFEAARAETSRLGWKPFMYDPALPALLKGVSNPTLLIRGDEDIVCPQSCVDVYASSLPNAQVSIMKKVGHRPEIEDSKAFVSLVQTFLS